MSDAPVLPAGWSMAPAETVSLEGHAALVSGLIGFNESRAGPPGYRPVAIYVTGPDGRIAGGLEGRTVYGWLVVELVFLPEPCRGRGAGRRLLAEAEAEAIRRGCHSARLDTLSFQARGFYEKQGYEVFGELPGFPGGHRLFFMRKALRAAARG